VSTAPDLTQLNSPQFSGTESGAGAVITPQN